MERGTFSVLATNSRNKYLKLKALATLYPWAFLTWQSRSTSLPTGTVMLSIAPTKDGSEEVSVIERTSGGGAASLLDEGRHAPEPSLLVVATPGTKGDKCIDA